MAYEKKVAVVTSRLKRLVTPNEPWVAGLRGVLRKIAADGAAIIVGDGTAGADFIRRGATHLNISCETVVAPLESTTGLEDPPRRDRIVIESADLIYVLNLRTGGNLHRLLRERLQQRRSNVILVGIAGLQPEPTVRELSELGAETWSPASDLCTPFVFPSSPDDDREAIPTPILSDPCLIAPLPLDEGWNLLTHTTRACPGPWPDESFESYAASLLASTTNADHSPLGTLQRIVSQRRLIASERTIRGGHRVVSFTACPLGQLPALHQFRPHRVRWDFEPFGLCIRREWLQSRGVRPVSYLNEVGWQSLAENDRPFFQLASGDSGIDWSAEQEWRHPGDLDLTSLTTNDVLLFVPNYHAAKSLARITTWPITLWPGEISSP